MAMEGVNKISKYLKENNTELYEYFRQIVAMAKYRLDARQEINAQSIPLFKHLIPYALMKKHGIVPPTNWVGEIKEFLLNIDGKNRRKNGLWFTAKEIQAVLDGLLDSIVMKKLIYKKLDSLHMAIPSPVREDINNFFDSEPKLEKLKIELKYVPSEEDRDLSIFINNRILS